MVAVSLLGRCERCTISYMLHSLNAHKCSLFVCKCVPTWTDKYVVYNYFIPASRGDAPGEMGDNLPAVPVGSGRNVTSMAAGYEHTWYEQLWRIKLNVLVDVLVVVCSCFIHAWWCAVKVVRIEHASTPAMGCLKRTTYYMFDCGLTVVTRAMH